VSPRVEFTTQIPQCPAEIRPAKGSAPGDVGARRRSAREAAQRSAPPSTSERRAIRDAELMIGFVSRPTLASGLA
jgi:hypothetical protein